MTAAETFEPLDIFTKGLRPIDSRKPPFDAEAREQIRAVVNVLIDIIIPVQFPNRMELELIGSLTYNLQYF